MLILRKFCMDTLGGDGIFHFKIGKKLWKLALKIFASWRGAYHDHGAMMK